MIENQQRQMKREDEMKIVKNKYDECSHSSFAMTYTIAQQNV